MICPKCNAEMEDIRHREDRLDWWCVCCKKGYTEVKVYEINTDPVNDSNFKGRKKGE